MGILGQKGQFFVVSSQNGRNEIFQKSDWNIFPPLQALANCKVKKVMKGFRENALRMHSKDFYEFTFEEPIIGEDRTCVEVRHRRVI